jgi:signal transduction histidine kinase
MDVPDDDLTPPRLSRAALDVVLRVSPWPAIALDERAAVIACSDEPETGCDEALRTRWPQYRQAIFDRDATSLVPRCVETTRRGADGELRHERLIMRRADWGACLFVVDRTEHHKLQIGNPQSVRLAALGFMIAGVSHELSNPLTSLHSVVQLLRSQDRLDADLLRRGLDSISGNVQRILEITDRLLGFSCLRDQPRAPLLIALAIDEALACARANGLFERIDLTVLHDPMAVIHGNIGQLRQVFSNLLVNAAQAMHGKGRIDVRTRRIAGRVDVAVADSGPGIASDVAPRIFDAFFTTRPSGGGTGLGLAISQQILKEHGGRLWFENNPDGGASFHAELPLVASGSSAEPPFR